MMYRSRLGTDLSNITLDYEIVGQDAENSFGDGLEVKPIP